MPPGSARRGPLSRRVDAAGRGAERSSRWSAAGYGPPPGYGPPAGVRRPVMARPRGSAARSATSRWFRPARCATAAAVRPSARRFWSAARGLRDRLPCPGRTSHRPRTAVPGWKIATGVAALAAVGALVWGFMQKSDADTAAGQRREGRAAPGADR